MFDGEPLSVGLSAIVLVGGVDGDRSSVA